ncbi:hypothetical protein AKO1_011625 [Acrasis kona]|uniref:Taste receptor type 2 n=1 Tax=Acrasis kona TaxID=1008807 RepID=A0AAW2Z796_9EUKA
MLSQYDISSFNTANNILNIILIVISGLEILLCLVVGVLVVIYHKQTFNALWATRLAILCFVIVWDVGIISGMEYLWYQIQPASSSVLTLSILCRTHVVTVYGIAHPAVTCCVIFVLFFRTQVKIDSDPRSAYLIPGTPLRERFRFPKWGSNVMIILKTLLVVLLVLIVHLVVMIIDVSVVAVVSTYIPESIFTMFSSEKLICTTPVVTIGLYIVYHIIFAITYNVAVIKIRSVTINRMLKRRILNVQILTTGLVLLGIALRTVEMVSVIQNWTGVDRLLRELSLFTDLAISLTITIYYIIIPLAGTISTARWAKKMELLEEQKLQSPKSLSTMSPTSTLALSPSDLSLKSPV